MRKTSNKKHSKGDNLIDNEQKPSYNKKVRSSDNGNKLYPKKGDVENDKDNGIDKDNNDNITDNPSNKTSNDIENNKDNSIDKDNNDDITNDPSNETLNDIENDKDNGVDKNNSKDINNDMLMTEEEGTLILHLYPDDKEGKGINGNGLPNNERNQKLKHRAQYRKNKKRLHKGELLPIKENLKLFKGPSKGQLEEPSERLRPVKENPGFEKFEEVSSDNKSNGKNHKKDEKKQAIINHLMNNSEFSFLKGFKQLIGDFLNDIILMDIPSSNCTRIPFIAKDENEIKNILYKLVGNIFNSVTGSTKSQVVKEILQRKNLRFHVKVWKSYVCLQAFCSANLKQNRGKTTRSQAKKKIIEEYPNIDLGDLDLMLQILPKIYRLLQVFNGNWVLLDVFEEITLTFFKSKIKVDANFEIWLNLVRTE
ncbi:hypothetical protein RhiirB3_470519 [Rhizophagus irregularis]|nr:hypothetical protein RhiirB3_470519 [Rhizophagus irregularis]